MCNDVKGEQTVPDEINQKLRALPAVDAVMQDAAAGLLAAAHGHAATVAAVRQAIERLRSAIVAGESTGNGECDPTAIAAAARGMLENAARPNLKRVVNATGIVLHTGLGRATMPDAAREALSVAAGCCNVQMELATGKRGRREEVVRGLLQELTGAEDVLLVNNNAGATMLVLRALAQGREVIISRGELIEIGGSFRLPDIMSESGVIMREVGTTNKTHLRDYESAIGPNTGLIMKAHQSNFKIVGFTRETGIAEIAEVGRKHGIPVVDDLGCGAMVGLEQYGLPHEMTVRESLEAGSDIVLFSTDKLIGGPQGGLIAGRKALIGRIKSHPLYRVLRVCKLTLAALEATLRLFRAPDLLAKNHPVYTMLAKTPVDIEMQARELAEQVRKARPDWKVSVDKTVSYLGGGSLPAEELPSFAVSITSPKQSAEAIAKALRLAAVPVIPRVSNDAVLLDLRTVLQDEMALVVKAAKEAGQD
ncbi:MAG: L-seryl-tRNA(Sec) selenium transferase [Verrucomicrobia bacterium]|nr:L-seryl-tRNA(Sec) selenium transferase [Verrucomicrobiota bacterium]